MTLTIELTPEQEQRLQVLADAEGQPLQEFIRSALEQIATPKEVDLKAFLALPADERRRRLQRSAELAAPLYEADLKRPVAERELTAFTALDDEDIYDYPDEGQP